MLLVPCQACSREISTEATACPGCGHPAALRAPGPPVLDRPTESEHVTIEKTSKALKGAQLLAVLVMILGIGGCAAGSKPFGSPMFMIGFATYALVRFSIWWNHG